MFIQYKDMKGDENAKIWVIWWVRVPKVIGNFAI